jgi:hypothetical protein
MKSAIKFLLLGSCFFSFASHSLAQTAIELDAWAKRQIEDTLKDCSHRSPKEVFGKLKKLEVDYSTKADSVPLPLLKNMPPESDFIEMGQVIFPAMLPRKYPARLIFMACDEENRAFMDSKTTSESKENLLELKDCFRRSYRIGTPKTVSVLIKCYEDLASTSI